MSRQITAAEAAGQGEVIYETGWPRRWGLLKMCGYVVWSAAWVTACGVRLTATAGAATWQIGLLFGLVWVCAVVTSLYMADMVEVTGTAVRRRGYLGALLGRGFRSVELAPNSWFVRSRRSATRVLWVGSRPHAAPQDILTMRLEFEDDPKALMAALTAVGVQVQDEHGEWLLRRPILARLEIALPTAYWASLPILVLIPIEFFASLSLVAVAALAVVHWKAR